ncbi:hypothetical protein ACFE04_007611 [Oxalis oulophora]
MKKGFKTFCTPATTTALDASTSTTAASRSHHHNQTRSPTLEELILQLDLEEELARKANKVNNRMSCVSNSDVLLESARNIALSQYPRFSLDGRDAMYRSSFRNLEEQQPGRKSVCSDAARFYREKRTLPQTLAGERVLWCKPGVVAKLMGLDVIPVPIKRQQNLKKKEFEKRLAMDIKNREKGLIRREEIGFCLKPARRHCAVAQPPPEPTTNFDVPVSRDWPTRRYNFY